MVILFHTHKYTKKKLCYWYIALEEIDFASSVAKRPPSASIEKNEKKKLKKEKQKKTTKQKGTHLDYNYIYLK